jgi:hypothetical protein
MNEDNKYEIDLLKRIERLTEEVNEMMMVRSKSVFTRYPLTFALLILFGVVAVGEGAKGILEQIPFFANSPLYLLAFGLIILIVTGTLYKKLDK